MQSNMLFTVWEMDRITYDMDDFAVGRLGVDRRRCGMPEVWWLILTNRGRWIVERFVKSFGAERKINLMRVENRLAQNKKSIS